MQCVQGFSAVPGTPRLLPLSGNPTWGSTGSPPASSLQSDLCPLSGIWQASDPGVGGSDKTCPRLLLWGQGAPASAVSAFPPETFLPRQLAAQSREQDCPALLLRQTDSRYTDEGRGSGNPTALGPA